MSLIMTGERVTGELTDWIPARGFCSFVAVTSPKLKKNPLGKVLKLSKVSSVLGASYASLVNKRLTSEQWEKAIEEGTEDEFAGAPVFEAMPRTWGVKRGNYVYHTKKGESEERVYLDCPVLSAQSVYYADGREISSELVKPYEYERTSRQGTDNAIIWANYELCNIHIFRANGKLWVRPERIIETFKFLP